MKVDASIPFFGVSLIKGCLESQKDRDHLGGRLPILLTLVGGMTKPN